MSVSLVLLRHLQEGFVWATLPAAVGFPLWYQWRIRWRRSPVGQHIMAYSTVVALLYLATLVQFIHISLTTMMWISMVITALMMIVVWWRVVIFVWIYREAHRARIEKEEEPIVSVGTRSED